MIAREEEKNDKKVKMKGGLGWIKRIERKHELARLVMETIFLV